MDAHKETLGSHNRYEELRKGYIRPLKLSQIALVFFVGKKDSK